MTISYLGIVLAAIASMVVGFVWYGWLFRKSWMSLMGITTESMSIQKGNMTPTKGYVIQFIASLLMGYVLTIIIWYFFSSTPGATPLSASIKAGFWLWLGFIAPVTVGSVLWEGRSWKLWFINASHYLAGLLAMSVVLSFFI